MKTRPRPIPRSSQAAEAACRHRARAFGRARAAASDEATSALDPETTGSILALLRDINRKLGLTIVLITHEMSVVRAIADRVVVLDHGRIVEEGDAAAVFDNPRAALTRRLLASIRNEAPRARAEAAEWIARAISDWTPGADTIFRITLEGERASRPALADLTAATGARPVILQAESARASNAAVATIVFSVRCPAHDLVVRIERYLTRAGARVEILGHAQPAA